VAKKQRTIEAIDCTTLEATGKGWGGGTRPRAVIGGTGVVGNLTSQGREITENTITE